MEKNMTKREYNIRQFMNALQEEEKKNKSISYQFYKSIGVINEDELKTQKSYDELVKDQINKIKNKFTVKFEEKKKEKIIKDESDKEDKSIRNLIYGVFAIYVIAMGYILYQKRLNKILDEEMKQEFKNNLSEKRFNKYLYLGGGNKE